MTNNYTCIAVYSRAKDAVGAIELLQNHGITDVADVGIFGIADSQGLPAKTLRDGFVKEIKKSGDRPVFRSPSKNVTLPATMYWIRRGRLSLLHLPQLHPGVPAPPLPETRDPRVGARVDPQPDVLPEAPRPPPARHPRRPGRGGRPGGPGILRGPGKALKTCVARARGVLCSSVLPWRCHFRRSKGPGHA